MTTGLIYNTQGLRDYNVKCYVYVGKAAGISGDFCDHCFPLSPVEKKSPDRVRRGF